MHYQLAFTLRNVFIPFRESLGPVRDVYSLNDTFWLIGRLKTVTITIINN